MNEQFSRSQLILGKENIDKICNLKVAVFGIGGVGGYVCEALARTGVRNFLLVDNDTISLTNVNRQIIANLDTLGKYKTEVMKERILSINKDANVEIRNTFFLPENENEFDFTKYDYIVDAVDTVSAKISLIVKAYKEGTKIISAMGAGNKINPTLLEVTDIYKTKVDPLAKVMRNELKKRRIPKLKVVYSKEKPLKPVEGLTEELKQGKRALPGSCMFVPSAMGIIIASEIIKDVTGIYNEDIGG